MNFGARLRYVWQRAGRQKQVAETDTHTNLRRCLSTLQMTAIGLGSTIGVGIYVLLGVAIRDYAGPGVILSFAVAGLVVLSNAVIYAEFGSYIPHTGASYTYMYRAVGELAAFLTGWMGFISGVCSAATGARAWSGFVDSLFNNSVQTFFDDKVGHLDLGPPFARSLDWMAFTFYLLLTLVVSCNVQCSSLINAMLAVLTTGVLVFVMFAGFIFGDLSRLADPDKGGFLPYGFSGVIAGTFAAFFAYSGYESICVSAEEAKNPGKSVPRAILIELLIVTVVYCGAAVGTASLIPYTDIDLRAPIPSAFAYQGLTWARYIVTIGPIIALTNLSLTGLYTQSRMFYRIAQDGLLFKQFAYVHPVTKVPLLGVVVCGVMAAVISLLLELKDLVRFAVLCMLFQYILLVPAFINLRISDKEKATSLNGSHTQYDSTEESGASSLQDDPKTTMFDQDTNLELTSQRKAECSLNVQESIVDDGSPGQTPSQAAQASAIKDYNPESRRYLENSGNEADESGLKSSPLNSPEPASNPPSTDFHQKDQMLPTTESPEASSEISPEERPAPSLRKRNAESTDESHDDTAPTSREPSCQVSSRDYHPDAGCFDIMMGEFFRLLTTKRCLILLVILLATLALQLGLAWEDLKRMKLLGVISITVIIVVIIFLCEVLRKRCGPGDHEGFKVPCVPYVPAVSCFLNLLLLVRAADHLGIIEFAVLVSAGVIVYVIMVMTQWSRENDVSIACSVESRESWTLLAHEGDEEMEDGF